LFGSQSGAQALGHNLAFLSEAQGDLTREVFQQLDNEKVSDKTCAEVGRSFVSTLSNEQLTKLGKTPAGVILLTNVGKTVAKDDSLQLPPFQFSTLPGVQPVQNKEQVLVRLANALGPNAVTLKLAAVKDFAQIREKQVAMQLANVRALNDIETANAPTVVTAAQILQIDPSVGDRAGRIAVDLNKMMFLAGITDKKAQAMFIAQVLHESKGADVFLRENSSTNYLTQMYDVTSSRSERRQAAIQNGNTEPGDGLKYYGQGYMQMTWKNNYRDASLYAGADLVEFPELASNPDVALRTTVKVWRGINARGVNLSTYIKDGTEEEFKRVTIGLTAD
jgi:predicted chitinase